ncbi:uncharacterized protein B0I36DRAFT_384788 [Microdochium trichocladiopsis]|uniref:Uncharacterized protein n=1 Tax=Microdochium trichocladiopsis TaxID=1682393 RepID=A0A9P9BPG7_9PEZI|nr:uncharacterized protein B0I36DRAFT_384788 [Microdochium trichocladiopsis]KAH7029244.1 hypothetical protein B0I36DRAFT_384788 [Microdochium trichocladiopsis]
MPRFTSINPRSHPDPDMGAADILMNMKYGIHDARGYLIQNAPQGSFRLSERGTEATSSLSPEVARFENSPATTEETTGWITKATIGPIGVNDINKSTTNVQRRHDSILQKRAEHRYTVREMEAAARDQKFRFHDSINHSALDKARERAAEDYAADQALMREARRQLGSKLINRRAATTARADASADSARSDAEESCTSSEMITAEELQDNNRAKVRRVRAELKGQLDATRADIMDKAIRSGNGATHLPEEVQAKYNKKAGQSKRYAKDRRAFEENESRYYMGVELDIYVSKHPEHADAAYLNLEDLQPQRETNDNTPAHAARSPASATSSSPTGAPRIKIVGKYARSTDRNSTPGPLLTPPLENATTPESIRAQPRSSNKKGRTPLPTSGKARTPKAARKAPATKAPKKRKRSTTPEQEDSEDQILLPPAKRDKKALKAEVKRIDEQLKIAHHFDPEIITPLEHNHRVNELKKIRSDLTKTKKEEEDKEKKGPVKSTTNEHELADNILRGPKPNPNGICAPCKSAGWEVCWEKVDREKNKELRCAACVRNKGSTTTCNIGTPEERQTYMELKAIKDAKTAQKKAEKAEKEEAEKERAEREKAIMDCAV